MEIDELDNKNNSINNSCNDDEMSESIKNIKLINERIKKQNEIIKKKKINNIKRDTENNIKEINDNIGKISKINCNKIEESFKENDPLEIESHKSNG